MDADGCISKIMKKAIIMISYYSILCVLQIKWIIFMMGVKHGWYGWLWNNMTKDNVKDYYYCSML